MDCIKSCKSVLEIRCRVQQSSGFFPGLVSLVELEHPLFVHRNRPMRQRLRLDLWSHGRQSNHVFCQVTWECQIFLLVSYQLSHESVSTEYHMGSRERHIWQWSRAGRLRCARVGEWARGQAREWAGQRWGRRMGERWGPTGASGPRGRMFFGCMP